MSVTIRSAIAGDVPLILQFIKDLAAYEKMAGDVEATLERLHQTLFGPNPVAHCLLASNGNEPVGFAIYFYSYSTFLAKPGLYLEDLFVKPDCRGRGVGKALILHLARLAHERGCGRMEWSVLNWNQSAIDFYESLGAIRLSGWTTCRLSGDALTRCAKPSA